VNTVALSVGEQGFAAYSVEWSAGQPVLTPSKSKPEIILVPGFVDLHIHGANGIDFMSASSAGMLQLIDFLAGEGYEAFLPTTVTECVDAVEHALDMLPEHPMVKGFHLEGPFISKAHPGAQPPEWICDFGDIEEWKDVLDDARLKLITLASEKAGALPVIRDLAARNVIVSLGHSDATFSQSQDAAAAGASHVTHTFNAMRGFHHREPGLAGFAVLDDAVSTELIYDRLHVSKPAAELLIRNKPADKVIAVSDSTMATRMPSGQRITMWGHSCVTSPGEVRLASNGALAGSAITVRDAFSNLVQDFGAEIAIRACSLNPRKKLGLQHPPKAWLICDLSGEIKEMRRS